MKFSKYLILIFSLFSLLSKAQKITNITTEQDGNNLNIYYDITGSKESQVYQIVIACETEGRRFVLKSVKGDVGDSIKGGSGKKIVWDVFKDVDSLGTANFSVRIEKIIELKSENSSNENRDGKFLKKGFSTQLKLGFTMGSNTFTPALELIAGYNVLPRLFFGIGVGYQSYGIKTSYKQNFSSGIPNYGVTNENDSFSHIENEVSLNSLFAVPIFINARYTFNDKKISPYIFTDIGTVLYGSADYSYDRTSLPAYDSIGFNSSGVSQYYSGFVESSTASKEKINSTATLTKTFFFDIGAGVKYPLAGKLYLTFDISYSFLNCTYNVNNQYYFHNYDCYNSFDINGSNYMVAFVHQSKELKDQITTEVKTFQSFNLKIGIIY